MLKRIRLIKQVGKYRDFNASNKEFSKFTIVEGENCAGKTTLIDIFKSLSADKELDKRKTLPDNDEPVEIVMTFGEENSQETVYKYSDKKWNKKYPNIQVFDTEFINRNVINGFEIGRENKENFTKFVIGEESLSLLTEIDGISQGIHNVLVNIKDNEGKLLKVIPENELKEFIELEVEEEMNEITEHIVEIKKREDILNNKLINIKKISDLKILNEITYTGEKIIEEVNQIKELLNVNIANVSNDVLDKFNEIKQKNNTIGKEEWLKDGLRLYEQNGNCPFCGQIISNTNEDIKIYNQIFSEQIVDIFEKIEYYETQYQYKDDINYIKSLSNNKYVAIDGIEDTMKSIGYDEHYRQILSQQEKINTQNGIIELKLKEIKA